jgi:hypothetical protein
VGLWGIYLNRLQTAGWPSPWSPAFSIAGEFFSLFAFGDVSKVAMMVNIMSALCSAFTILFLFWTITMLGLKFVKESEMTTGEMIAIIGSGLVGALAYTFSDSFWFSAVEGEVYAMSSFFTAIVFWAILKWERVHDQPHSLKWIILIAFLIGCPSVFTCSISLLSLQLPLFSTTVVTARLPGRACWSHWVYPLLSLPLSCSGSFHGQ